MKTARLLSLFAIVLCLCSCNSEKVLQLQDEDGDVVGLAKKSPKIETIDSLGTKETIPIEPGQIKNFPEDVSSSNSSSFQEVTYNIGIIPVDTSCPGGTSKIRIWFDDENSSNNNQAGGFTAGWILGSNTTQYYCKLNETESKKFFSIAGAGDFRSYAVLKLGTTCPNGGYTVTRYHDSEDNAPPNNYTGDIYPNVVNNNIRLYFCYYPSQAVDPNSGVQRMSNFPSISGFSSYGVISDRAGDYYGYRRHDDEDNSNNNSHANDAMAATASSWLYNYVINVGANTRYWLSRIQ